MLALVQTSSPKKQYRTPELLVYGNVGQLTLKDGPAQDQNQGGNLMYWTYKTTGAAGGTVVAAPPPPGGGRAR